jgi:phenylalanyl-tRNA synthetase beta chain
MRISLNWLRDYLEIKNVQIEKISESLTLAGLEVEGVEELKERAQLLSLGVIEDIHNKNGETKYKLNVLGKSLEVSGPHGNYKQGMVVALYPDEKTSTRLRLATYGDLGLLAGQGELIAIPQELVPDSIPEHLSSLKDFDDVIFTLSITPNRADALSHLGVSRELSALLDMNPRSFMLTPKEMAGPTHEKVTVEIDNADDCPRYACRVVENIVVAESPFWLKLRLIEASIRPINNVVDVTNYVMLSRGQPMHAFDYDQISRENNRAKIIVRRALDKEEFLSLEGKKVTLSAEDVVIADMDKPLALAGVIGGSASAVKEGTTTVLLESAYFDPKNVRMTARRHGISTESSYRFERGADPNGVVDALNYAARLLTEISDAKVCREPIDAYRKRIDPKEIMMRPERAQAILGIDANDFDQDLIRKRFLRLGIETVAKRGDAIYFRVPTHRFDLTREIDLIEEAARMIGYDKVKETYIGLGKEIDNFCNKKCELVTKKIRDTLVGRGFFETVNYGFLNEDYQNSFIGKDNDKVIGIANPLSDRYGVMRVSLIPSLIRNLLHNQRNQEKSIQLFEVGTVFLGRRAHGERPEPKRLDGGLSQDSFAIEKPMLAGVMVGKVSFSAFDVPSRMFDFYDLKGVLSEIFHALGFRKQFRKADLFFESGTTNPYCHPGASATAAYRSNDGDSRVLGSLGQLHPQIAATLEVVGDVFLFELDLEELGNIVHDVKKFTPFSRYPTIERDVAFLADESVKVGDILDSINDIDAENNVFNVRVFDIYRGKNLAAGKKSVAVTLSLQHEDRTLTDEEADSLVSNFVKAVEQKTGASLR